MNNHNLTGGVPHLGAPALTQNPKPEEKPEENKPEEKDPSAPVLTQNPPKKQSE